MLITKETTGSRNPAASPGMRSVMKVSIQTRLDPT